MMRFSENMRGAPKDGRLILIDTFPEAKQPVAAFWSGKWWMSPAGGWVNGGKRWAEFPTEHTTAPQSATHSAKSTPARVRHRKHLRGHQRAGHAGNRLYQSGPRI